MQHSDPSAPSFYFPDFFLSNTAPWFQHEHWQEISQEALSDLIQPSTEAKSIAWKQPNETLFLQSFADIQARLASKELRKAVPFAFALSAESMTSSLFHRSFGHIIHYIQSHPLHLYGFWDRDEGILGATPELLFSMESSVLHTVALAGTYSKSASKSALLQDPKELHEHQLVVDGIKEGLEPFSSVSAGKVSVLELPTLYHLMTPIEARLHDAVSFDAVVKALHPTPALGAFPRPAGMRWLKSFRAEVDRGRFGAPAGVVYAGGAKAQCWVAIRNVQWNRDGLALGAGCGVVPASQPNKEWAEINLKLDAIKRMLAL